MFGVSLFLGIFSKLAIRSTLSAERVNIEGRDSGSYELWWIIKDEEHITFSAADSTGRYWIPGATRRKYF
jgi:hypothetical protein